MGLRIRVPGASFSGPYLNPIDPVLPRHGAVLLIEPGHPLSTWAGIIPDHVPNLAEESAVALGLTTSVVWSGGLNATNKAERTSKGGLHLAHAASDSTANSGLLGTLHGSVMNHIRTTKPKWYMSLWARSTLLNVAPAPGTLLMAASNTQHFLSIRKAGLAGAPNNLQVASKIGSGALGTTIGPAQLQPSFYAGSVDTAAFYAATPTNAFFTDAAAAIYALIVGNVGNQDNSTRGAQGAHIYYRVYMEDLTVSGRTYAQARDADLAEYTRQVLTLGGRYYGDTWTDPATLLAA